MTLRMEVMDLGTKPPNRHEPLSSDVERWQLEMAQELGIVDEIKDDRGTSGLRPVLRPHHPRPHGKQISERIHGNSGTRLP